MSRNPGYHSSRKTEREVAQMKGFTARDKMSAKARRNLDLEKRRTWAISPVTKVKESGKLYNRKMAKAIRIED